MNLHSCPFNPMAKKYTSYFLQYINIIVVGHDKLIAQACGSASPLGVLGAA